MLGAALDWAIRWRINGLSSSGQRHSKDKVLVEGVYEHFLRGITAGLSGTDGAKLAAIEEGVPWAKRLFFWEGNAFGLCAMHASLGRSGNPFKNYHAPGFRLMFWTGLGFWNGASKPMPTISLNPSLWSDVPEFQEEYPLILGGSAFSVIASTAAVNKSRLEDIPGIRNTTTDTDGVYLGVGRALWFLYTRNHAKLAEALDADPDHAEQMARGLGVAMTLTQLDAPERVFSEIAAMPSVYWEQLLAGSLMAFTCLLMDDTRAAEPLRRFPSPLDVLINETHANLASYGGPGWTERFAELGEKHIRQWNGLQPPAVATTAAAMPEGVAAK